MGPACGGSVRLFAAFAILTGNSLCGQSPGVPQEWEVRKDLAVLVEQIGKLEPLLHAVKPAEWTQKGAPEAYIAQRDAILAESGYLARSAGELANDPERLTLALETYLRLESLDAQLDSLNEGIRKYQNPALADLIQEAMTGGAAARNKLRQYVVQLAALKEDQLRVADREAQRCREGLLQQTPARSPAKKAVPK
jgi:hypothetical protein